MAITEGSRVKCINAEIKPEMIAFVIECVPNWLRKGQAYTIRQICTNDGIVDGYLLEEIVNPPTLCVVGGEEFYIEPRFATWRFAEEEEEVAVNFAEDVIAELFPEKEVIELTKPKQR
tara:strand:- start:591 stop:944 length:354 start_codon:yes stop_codon:yes gene_type:complete